MEVRNDLHSAEIIQWRKAAWFEGGDAGSMLAPFISPEFGIITTVAGPNRVHLLNQRTGQIPRHIIVKSSSVTTSSRTPSSITKIRPLFQLDSIKKGDKGKKYQTVKGKMFSRTKTHYPLALLVLNLGDYLLSKDQKAKFVSTTIINLSQVAGIGALISNFTGKGKLIGTGKRSICERKRGNLRTRGEEGEKEGDKGAEQ